MKIISLTILLTLCLNALAQENPTELAKPIVEEGKYLYKLEMASWYGTDIFLEKYKNRDNLGGYLSYLENDTARCIFYSKTDNPVVIGTISFDSTYNVNTAKAELIEREFSSKERKLYEIRAITFETIQSDTLFQYYNNTNFNLIPLIYKGEKKVYILTGPQQSGVVIFGNDYLVVFNEKNEIIQKKQLHRNIIPIYYGNEDDEEKNIVGAMHSHTPETGDFMTPTDICTLMLYSKYANWKTHTVVSKKYMNIWNCETNSLIVVPKDAFKETTKDSREKDKKKNKEKKKIK